MNNTTTQRPDTTEIPLRQREQLRALTKIILSPSIPYSKEMLLQIVDKLKYLKAIEIKEEMEQNIETLAAKIINKEIIEDNAKAKQSGELTRQKTEELLQDPLTSNHEVEKIRKDANEKLAKVNKKLGPLLTYLTTNINNPATQTEAHIVEIITATMEFFQSLKGTASTKSADDLLPHIINIVQSLSLSLEELVKITKYLNKLIDIFYDSASHKQFDQSFKKLFPFEGRGDSKFLFNLSNILSATTMIVAPFRQALTLQNLQDAKKRIETLMSDESEKIKQFLYTSSSSATPWSTLWKTIAEKIDLTIFTLSQQKATDYNQNNSEKLYKKLHLTIDELEKLSQLESTLQNLTQELSAQKEYHKNDKKLLPTIEDKLEASSSLLTAITTIREIMHETISKKEFAEALNLVAEKCRNTIDNCKIILHSAKNFQSVREYDSFNNLSKQLTGKEIPVSTYDKIWIEFNRKTGKIYTPQPPSVPKQTVITPTMPINIPKKHNKTETKIGEYDNKKIEETPENTIDNEGTPETTIPKNT